MAPQRGQVVRSNRRDDHDLETCELIGVRDLLRRSDAVHEHGVTIGLMQELADERRDADATRHENHRHLGIAGQEEVAADPGGVHALSRLEVDHCAFERR
jgi:hypothetical protein